MLTDKQCKNAVCPPDNRVKIVNGNVDSARAFHNRITDCPTPSDVALVART